MSDHLEGDLNGSRGVEGEEGGVAFREGGDWEQNFGVGELAGDPEFGTVEGVSERRLALCSVVSQSLAVGF